MRIELNSGGLGSGASIESMQSNISALIGRSNALLSAFNNIKTYIYNMNGGVGNLQDALSDVESRIQTEENCIDNLDAASEKIDSFIELTHQIDTSVTNTVTKNQSEFYEMNPWSRPECGASGEDDDKAWYEEVWDWFCDVGNAIVDTAEKIWGSITSFYDWVKERLGELYEDISDWWADMTTITPTEINNTVFDPDNPGYYGGNQMIFEGIEPNSDKWVEMYEIFRSNNPDIELTDAEFQNYLEKLTSEGCGYVAICNTIFEQYEGRADEFEATFGYPMYDTNGNLNYAALEMDMYSQMDNRNALGILNYFSDYDIDDDGSIFDYDYWNDNSGNGTDPFDREYYLEQFMSEHGVDVNVTPYAYVTVNNYDNIIASGNDVVVSFHDGNLYNMDGTFNQTIDGGHAMTVTGVTEDGMFIVSSWGNQYLINPSENGNTITLEEGTDNEHTITQSMSFSIIEYE